MSTWRIRKADLGIYGPVEWDDIQRWAAEGRVLPEDALSENDGPWQPATGFASLELDWLLERPDGTTVGPLPAKVFAESVRTAILTGAETVRHRSTGERQTTAQLAIRTLVLETERLRTALAAAKQQADLPIRPEKSETTGLENAHQELTRRYEALLAQTREQNEALNSLRRQLAEARSEPQSKIDELQESLRAATAELELRRIKIVELESHLAERIAIPETDELAAPAGQPEKAHATGLEKSYQDLTRRYEALLARTREQNRVLKTLRRELADAEPGPHTRIAELQESLRAATAELDLRQKRIKELESHIAQISRDHRDLNERYIRLRDSAGDAQGGKPKVRLA